MFNLIRSSIIFHSDSLIYSLGIINPVTGSLKHRSEISKPGENLGVGVTGSPRQGVFI